jgi:tripartite-type tricarboxylate transporter receptor subunit TctC
MGACWDDAMELARRKFLEFAVGGTALPAVSRIARAQAYPARPVRLVVGFPAGGIYDTYARLIGQWLSRRLGQSVVIENRSGAGGSIATETVVRAAPDGYTLLMTGSNDCFNTALYDNLSFSYTRDIEPVAGISRFMGVLVVHPSFPARTVTEFIAHVKRDPGGTTVASDGVGSAPHIFWELFRSMAKVDMLHVPYRGAAPALTDLLSGQVQTYFCTMASSLEYIRSGKLRPLGVTGAARAEVLPDVPTIGEFVRGYEATGWAGIVAPRNTSAQIIENLNNEINTGLADPTIKLRIAEFGDTAFTSSPSQLGKFVGEFTEKWAKVIRMANIKL